MTSKFIYLFCLFAFIFVSPSFAAFPIPAATENTVSGTDTHVSPGAELKCKSHLGFFRKVKMLWAAHNRQWHQPAHSNRSGFSILSFCLCLGGYALIMVAYVLAFLTAAVSAGLAITAVCMLLAGFVFAIMSLARGQRFKGLAMAALIMGGAAAVGVAISLVAALIFLVAK